MDNHGIRRILDHLVSWLTAPTLFGSLFVAALFVLRGELACSGNTSSEIAWPTYLTVSSFFLLLIPLGWLLIRLPSGSRIYFLGWLAAANAVSFGCGWPAFLAAWKMNC